MELTTQQRILVRQLYNMYINTYEIRRTVKQVEFIHINKQAKVLLKGRLNTKIFIKKVGKLKEFYEYKESLLKRWFRNSLGKELGQL